MADLISKRDHACFLTTPQSLRLLERGFFKFYMLLRSKELLILDFKIDAEVSKTLDQFGLSLDSLTYPLNQFNR